MQEQLEKFTMKNLIHFHKFDILVTFLYLVFCNYGPNYKNVGILFIILYFCVISVANSIYFMKKYLLSYRNSWLLNYVFLLSKYISITCIILIISNINHYVEITNYALLCLMFSIISILLSLIVNKKNFFFSFIYLCIFIVLIFILNWKNTLHIINEYKVIELLKPFELFNKLAIIIFILNVIIYVYIKIKQYYVISK